MKLFMVNKYVGNLLWAAGLLWAVLLLNACARQPMQFYMLDAEAEAAPVATGGTLPPGMTVGLGPVHLPQYLNRPQMVIETADNQYSLDEQHRWAERLDENVARSLSQQLAARLEPIQLLRFPWSHRQAPDYQVSVDIQILHQAADGYSRLQGQWQIRHQEQPVLGRRFNCRLAASDGVNGIVKAQSLCLSRLGLAIEEGLRESIKP
jgi:hypothetical protein